MKNRIIKQHEVNIYVNNQLVDVYSQDALNLRFNNIFTDPSKIQTISAEYSFSFTLPVTKTNEKIFDYANVLSKRNKFNKRYLTHVNVDGMLIFDGELILTSVNKDGYKCNLYINKLNTVDSIFGNTTMSEITNWKIDYDQDKTINAYNSKETIQYPQDCFFPLVSYGMFQKLPKKNETYTSKFLIDDYNIIYNENFLPSLNLLKTVKKCFETKGYQVEGDIFDDDTLKKIYMSTNLADKQDVEYNYGKPEMGNLILDFNWKSYVVKQRPRGDHYLAWATNITQDLDAPRFYLGKDTNGTDIYGWEKNNIYDIWSSGDEYLTWNAQPTNNNLWRQNRIVAPADGYYKIFFNIEYDLDTSRTFTSYGYRRKGRYEFERYEYTPTVDFRNFFVEFQLIKNSQDGLDTRMITPDSISNQFSSMPTPETPYPTVDDTQRYLYSAYPHESPGSYTLSSPENKYPMGYIGLDMTTMGYDPSVNKNFICGMSTAGPMRYTSVIKNGKSWNPECSDVNQSRYSSGPYYGIKVVEFENEDPRRPNTKKEYEETTGEYKYGNNTLDNSPGYFWVKDGQTGAQAKLGCIVYLKKNDYIQLKMIQRQFPNKQDVDAGEGSNRPSSNYVKSTDLQTDAALNLKARITFEAFSPDDIGISNPYFDWSNPSRFDTQLNLSKFLNKEEKMSDFINNFIKEFNLSYSQSGKVITMNKQKLDYTLSKNLVNLTDRVTDDEIESEAIEFPSQIAVEYNINEDERGFYTSAEKNTTEEQFQSNNWKEYADRGYDIIKLTADEDNKGESNKIKTSYNWYEDFKVTKNNQDATISIPIIAKDEWMIDGYRDAEMMKKDGMGLHRRYWAAGQLLTTYLPISNDINRKVYIRKCTNDINGVDISYKVVGETLLTKYFNIFYDTDTNYIKFKCYLTTEEYVDIKNGALISIDDDVYIPVELQGYDCSGRNMTQITAIKK